MHLYTDAFQPPLDDWKRILDEMNSKARRLEEEYEITCTMKKVFHSCDVMFKHSICCRKVSVFCETNRRYEIQTGSPQGRHRWI